FGVWCLRGRGDDGRATSGARSSHGNGTVCRPGRRQGQRRDRRSRQYRRRAGQLAVVPNDTAALIKRLCKLAPKRQLRCCYEAGPTGYGLCRDLRAAKIRCTVVAPSLVPRAPGERIKTDRRDAVKLARFLRSDDLTEVVLPDSSTEAMRDLERAREDAKNAERVVRHQLQKFLLRHGRRYPEKTSWTQAHLRWIESQHFEHEAQKRVLTDALRAVHLATARIEQLDKDIAELVESWSMKPLVDGLQA